MRLAPLALLVLALAPFAAAHVPFDRPSLQPTEPVRDVEIEPARIGAAITLLQASDPLRHSVRHEVDPRGALGVEHRPDLSRPPSFSARIQLDRLAEYRDLNADAKFTPEVDTIARQWRLSSQPWTASVVQNVTLGGLRGKSMTWTADLLGNPHFSLTAAAAGQQVVDEGALARPQDVLLYFDVSSLPPRGTGHLHLLEGSFVAPSGATLHEVLGADNATAGVYVERGNERAYLLWGAQATLDGREQLLTFSTGEPAEAEGNVTWPFRLHFPLTDRTMHLVMVQAIEYAPPASRTPGPGLAAVVVAAVAAAAVGLRPQPRPCQR